MEEQKLVCMHCGKNGDEVTIAQEGHYLVWVDKYGKTKADDIDYGQFYCRGCGSASDKLITVNEYKALIAQNREKQIDDILKD